MANFDSLPQLTLRDAKRETEVAAEARLIKGFLRPTKSLTLLIHGFNVNPKDAWESYSKFCSSVQKLPYGSYLSDDLCLVHWPGNHSNGFLKFIVNPVMYYKQVWKTPKVAQALSRFLEQRAQLLGGLELTVVAHSLGARVTAELTSELLANARSVTLKSCIWMAAAVPDKTLSVTSTPRFSIQRWSHRACLHSYNDLVLMMAFRPGQAMAGEALLGAAVGRHGNPRALWEGNIVSTGLGHGGYWKSEFGVHALAKSFGKIVPVSNVKHELFSFPEIAPVSFPEYLRPGEYS